jgi:hypothetical protein
MADQYLSYSGRKTYLVCPKQYELRYILRIQVVRDARNTFLGSVIGKVFEWFYAREFWKQPDPLQACLGSIEAAIQDTFRQEKGFDPSTDPTLETKLLNEARALVPGGLEVIRANGFLTPFSRAEADLTVTSQRDGYDFTLKLGGRCDFIHGQSRTDVWILDGKASQWREKYVDPQQLIWYGVQHYVKYHVMPTRLGFIFWSHPTNAVQWVEFTPADMRKSVEQTFETVKKIRLRQFDATPSSECYRCDYKDRCPDGKRWMANRKMEGGGRIESSIFDPEIVT